MSNIIQVFDQLFTADRIFVTEDLTKHRQSIVKELNIARKAKKISSFWTFDGRMFAG
jgi:hypothetical protein